MWSITSLLGHLRGRSPRTRAGRPRSRAPRQPRPAARLRVEELEDRVLLSATLVKDINLTNVGAIPPAGNFFLAEMGGLVFFTAFSAETGTELWKTDGT